MIIGKALDFSILSNPLFLLVGLANILYQFGYFVPLFYLPDFATLNHYTKEEAAQFIMAIGMTLIYCDILALGRWYNDLVGFPTLVNKCWSWFTLNLGYQHWLPMLNLG